MKWIKESIFVPLTGRSLLLLIAVLIVSLPSLGQNVVVSGNVVADDNEPLVGVTVQEKGTSNGTLTDIDGNFNISVGPDAVLIFSYVGFDVQEIVVGNQSTIALQMQSNTAELSEVVVIGYGSIERSSLTTSVSSIDQAELNNLPVPGIDQALQGRLAGVTINNNGGQPGGGISVNIRGITSVNGSQPLYVIDGVPIGADRSSLDQSVLGGTDGQTSQSAIATLNPSDIQSIEVLKDASAQAIYGSRAANGVVLITTKKGSGSNTISYDTYFGVQQIPSELSVMNLQQNATYVNQIIGEVNAVDGTTIPVPARFANPSFLGEGTDWQDEIYQQGSVQSHMISFSGSQNKSNYYFSVGAFQQEGTLIGTEFNRYTLRANLETDVTDWFTAGFTINGTRSNQAVGITDAIDAVTTVVLFNSPAAPVRDQYGNFLSQVQINGQTIGNLQNPVAIANFRDVRAFTTRAIGSLYSDIDLGELVPKLSGITFRNEFNYDVNFEDNKAFQPSVVNEEQDVNILSPSRLQERREQNFFYLYKSFLNYRTTIGGDHNLFVTLGHEIQRGQGDFIQASRQNLVLNLPALSAGEGGDGSGETIDSDAWEYGMNSYFGRVNYSFAGKYALSATMRADASSSFGSNNRWGYFPAVSAAWTFTNESFIPGGSILKYGKLRAGWGQVGNQDIAANQYTANVNLVPISPFGNGSLPANVPNPDLSWESVETINAGIDLRLFEDDKITLSLDWYKKTTKDMLLPTQLPSYSGLGTDFDDIETPIVNGGEMTNKGIDISITSQNMNRGSFSWSTTVIFSQYKNELDFLNSEDATIQGQFDEFGSTTLVALTRQGFPVGSFYGFVTDGLFTTEEELNSLTYPGLTVAPNSLWLGDVKYKDLNDDGIIDQNDATVIGNPNPDFTLGITNNFTYKNFDLSVFVYGSFGADIFNYSRRFTEGLSSTYNNQLTTVFDRYTETNQGASMPRYNQWHEMNIAPSDRFIEDGTYVRIQNVQIGYNIPSSILSKAKITSLRVYISGQNLHTFTDYSGYDPELGTISDNVDDGILFNVDNGRYPVPRTFQIGANLKF